MNWIETKKQLPENGQTVLIYLPLSQLRMCMVKNIFYIAQFRLPIFSFDHKFCTDDGAEIDVSYVTHWAALEIPIKSENPQCRGNTYVFIEKLRELMRDFVD